MKTTLKVFGFVVGGIVLLALAGFGALFLVNWNDFRTYAATEASGVSGRKVEIHGNLDVKIGWWPTVVVQNVDFANADWGSRPQMVHIDRMELNFRLMSVLFGPLEIDRLKLAGLDVLLETDGKRKNWQFETQSASATAVKATVPKRRTEFPGIRHLELTDAALTYRAPNLQESVQIRLRKLSLEAPAQNQPVTVAARGTSKGQALAIDGTLGAFDSLHDDKKPYPLKLQGRAGPLMAKIDAGIVHPLNFEGIDGTVVLQGKSLSDLYQAFGLPLPKTDPFEIGGQLQKKGETWILKKFRGRLGGSDLNGTLQVDTGGQRPKIVADLASNGLRAVDFEGFWAAKHQTPQAKEKHVFSREPFSLPKLNRMDAAVKFRGKAIRSGKLDVRGVVVELDLTNGLLRLKPIELLLGKGRIAADMDLDTRQPQPLMGGHVQVSGLDLKALLKQLGVDTNSAGSLQGELALKLRGHSPHELAASASGQGLIQMGGGRIDDLVLQLMALDLQQALGQLVDHDQVPINCFVAPIQIGQGKIAMNPWLFDTTDHLVEIRGTIDLGKEMLQVSLTPHPKDFSVFNALSTIRITGDLAQRKAQVNKLEAVGQLVLKTLAAPFIALISKSIEEESRAMSPCRALFDRLRQSAGAGTSATADVALDVAKKAKAGKADEAKRAPATQRGGPGSGKQPQAQSLPPQVSVAGVQRALRRTGIDVRVDGLMGPQTKAALRLFQKRHGLPQTGTIDEATMLALGLSRPDASGPGARAVGASGANER